MSQTLSDEEREKEIKAGESLLLAAKQAYQREYGVEMPESVVRQLASKPVGDWGETLTQTAPNMGGQQETRNNAIVDTINDAVNLREFDQTHVIGYEAAGIIQPLDVSAYGNYATQMSAQMTPGADTVTTPATEAARRILGDTDNNGSLSRQEALAAFDKNKDGHITNQELGGLNGLVGDRATVGAGGEEHEVTTVGGVRVESQQTLDKTRLAEDIAALEKSEHPADKRKLQDLKNFFAMTPDQFKTFQENVLLTQALKIENHKSLTGEMDGSTDAEWIKASQLEEGPERDAALERAKQLVPFLPKNQGYQGIQTHEEKYATHDAGQERNDKTGGGITPAFRDSVDTHNNATPTVDPSTVRDSKPYVAPVAPTAPFRDSVDSHNTIRPDNDSVRDSHPDAPPVVQQHFSDSADMHSSNGGGMGADPQPVRDALDSLKPPSIVRDSHPDAPPVVQQHFSDSADMHSSNGGGMGADPQPVRDSVPYVAPPQPVVRNPRPHVPLPKSGGYTSVVRDSGAAGSAQPAAVPKIELLKRPKLDQQTYM